MKNPSDDQIGDLLKRAKTIAVVGLSNNPEKASYGVSSYLQDQGYKIIPVNPGVSSVLGENAVASLLDIAEPVDIVDVFRRSEQVPEVAEQVLQMKQKPKAFWLQLGIINDEACEQVSKAGITAIQDACIKVEHRRILG